MNLKSKFLNSFRYSKEVTTGEILAWYTGVKNSAVKHTYASTIFNLLIKPLLVDGIITRIDRGRYRINQTPVFEEHPHTILNEEDLEFERYINSKLRE